MRVISVEVPRGRTRWIIALTHTKTHNFDDRFYRRDLLDSDVFDADLSRCDELVVEMEVWHDDVADNALETMMRVSTDAH